MAISDNIAAIRKSAGITQSQLAEQVGVVRQTVAKWENGTALPDLENIKGLASALCVSIDTLVGYEYVDDSIPFLPRGKKYYGKCKVGSFGTVRIPEEAMKIFDLQAGDEVVVLGNSTYGIGLCKPEQMRNAIKVLEERLGIGS